MISKHTKRRLSAPGRRKSLGIELKPNVETKRRGGSTSGPHAHFLDAMPNNQGEENWQVGLLRPTTTDRPENPLVQANQNFRAPVRLTRVGERLIGHTCQECDRFAQLLRSEKVSESVIQAASKHRYFCAPSSTPANIWEPWEIESVPLTLLN